MKRHLVCPNRGADLRSSEVIQKRLVGLRYERKGGMQSDQARSTVKVEQLNKGGHANSRPDNGVLGTGGIRTCSHSRESPIVGGMLDITKYRPRFVVAPRTFFKFAQNQLLPLCLSIGFIRFFQREPICEQPPG